MKEITCGYLIGDFYLDCNDKKNRKLYLRNYLFSFVNNNDLELLEMLIEDSPNVVNKDKIEAKIFNHTNGESSIRKSIETLRKVFNDNEKQELIKTIVKQGYLFAGEYETFSANPFAKIEDNTANGSQSTNEDLDSDIQEEVKQKNTDENPSSRLFVWSLFISILLGLLISFIISASQPINSQNKIFGEIFTISGSIVHVIVLSMSLVYFHINVNKQKTFRPINEDIDKNGEPKTEIKNIGYKTRESWEKGRKIAQVSFRKYSRYWGGLLFAWLVLYAFIGLFSYIGIANYPDPKKIPVWFIFLKDSIYNLCNNVNTLFIFLCFFALYKHLKIADEKNEKKIGGFYFWLGSIAIAFMFFVRTIAFFLITSINDLGKDFDENSNQATVMFVFRIISGFLGGVALALYIGRLQSKFLQVSSPLLFLLFSYVAIQPLFVFFDDANSTAFIVFMALTLKCFLIIFMFRLFQSGQLLYYFVRHRLKYELEWKNFSKILK